LGLLSNPKLTQKTRACWQWLTALGAAGRRVIVPEITDYEVRRELIRRGLTASVLQLNKLAKQIEYLGLNTIAMRKAADLWAQARQAGQPTAGENTIDCDVILAAQALTLGVPDVLVATDNVGHLSRFVPAELWHNITP
jgi:predicted nucleic acid-binding protein